MDQRAEARLAAIRQLWTDGDYAAVGDGFRAAAAGLSIAFVEGDLLDVPYPDAGFDLVVSTFGVFLADDPTRCAAELVRVTRPGGRVVATAWAGDAAFSRMVALAHQHDPEVVPDGRPSPWADEHRLREPGGGRHHPAATYTVATITRE